MTYYCNNCGKMVEDVELISAGTWWRGREHGACPHCKSERLEEASKCELCGSPSVPGEQLCEGCKTDFRLAFDNAVAKIATWNRIPSTEINKIEKLFIDYVEYEVEV